jgi:thiamine-phosphate pyrophosphorylase
MSYGQLLSPTNKAFNNPTHMGSSTRLSIGSSIRSSIGTDTDKGAGVSDDVGDSVNLSSGADPLPTQSFPSPGQTRSGRVSLNELVRRVQAHIHRVTHLTLKLNIEFTNRLTDCNELIGFIGTDETPGSILRPDHSLLLTDVWLGVFEGSRQLHFELVDAFVVSCAWLRQSIRLGGFDPKAWPSDFEDFGIGNRGYTPLNKGGYLGSQIDPYFAPCPKQLGLYAVAPSAQWIKLLASLGVPTVQLRFKSDDAKLIEGEIFKAVEYVKTTKSLLFINDHWRLALKAKAYGVHLGQEDLELLSEEELRELRDSGIRLGISTHGYYEMIQADRVSPSYIALGAIYPTTLKQMKTLPQGVHRVEHYAALLSNYPLVGIGGVNTDNMSEVLATGVGSVAMVRALIGSQNPQFDIPRIAEQVKNYLQ